MSEKGKFFHKIPVTVKEALTKGVSILAENMIETAMLDCEILLAKALNLSKVQMYIKMDNALSEYELSIFEQYLSRRIIREPVSYITGVKEFYSLEFKVGPGVLAPRPLTEILVEQALKFIKKCDDLKNLKVLDVGTGSAAIPVSILKNSDLPNIYAVEISKEAFKIALHNAQKHGLRDKITFWGGDLFSPVEGKFDLIVSNPPYIKRREIDRLAEEIKVYEPRQALDGGSKGLDCIYELLNKGIDYLKENGIMIIEIGEDHSKDIKELEVCSKYDDISFIKDFSKAERFLVAKR